MRFAICNEIFQNWRIEDAIPFVARTGYDGLEIAPFTLANHVTEVSKAERQRLRDLAAGAGLAISGIHWVLVKTEGMHLTHPDAVVRACTARYFRELVDFCADLGGEYIVVGSPKQRSLMPGVTGAQAQEWAAALFREVVGQAEDRGVTLCLEPLAPAETDFINTAAAAIQFLESLRSPRLKLILDVKAMCSETRSIPAIIRSAREHLAHFHANDPNLKGPGFGQVDYGPIAGALREIGYRGYVSVEVFNFDEGPEVIARQSLAYLRQAFGSPAAPA